MFILTATNSCKIMIRSTHSTMHKLSSLNIASTGGKLHQRAQIPTAIANPIENLWHELKASFCGYKTFCALM